MLSKGGGIYPRTQKSISLSKAERDALGIEAANVDPATLINAILKAPVDLHLVRRHRHLRQSLDAIATSMSAIPPTTHSAPTPTSSAPRPLAKAPTSPSPRQGGSSSPTKGGRINTDFIDNSAGVDCSDNEVNIKIPLNREMREGGLSEARRNTLLAKMTDEVAEIVLEDNRLQSLALSIAESGGAFAVPGYVRTIELLESPGRLDRKVEGLASSEDLLRRIQEGTRTDPARARGPAFDLQDRA